MQNLVKKEHVRESEGHGFKSQLFKYLEFVRQTSASSVMYYLSSAYLYNEPQIFWKPSEFFKFCN